MTKESADLRILLLLLCLFSCTSKVNDQVSTFTGIAMTVPYKIIIGDSLDRNERKIIQNVIEETFSEIDRIYNKWNPLSEISRINRAAKNTPILLSNELLNFLMTVDVLVKLTEGRFDPTVEPIQQLWKSHFEVGELPSAESVQEYKGYIGWGKLRFQNKTISKDHQRVSLDLGGTVKGYAIDLIADRLDQLGFHNLYVEWGGDLTTKGMHPDGRRWRVLVTKWGVPGDSSTVVELSGNAIASSGDYLQNWTANGSTYSHIFNPDSGAPLKITGNSISSVSVVAPSCLLADTIATAAMVHESPEEAVKWLENVKESYPSLRYWIFTRREFCNSL